MTDRNYFAAHCPQSWIDRQLCNRSINDYKRALHKRKMISSKDFNEYGWDPTTEEKQLLECIIHFEYADMMIKASDYGVKE